MGSTLASTSEQTKDSVMILTKADGKESPWVAWTALTREQCLVMLTAAQMAH